MLYSALPTEVKEAIRSGAFSIAYTLCSQLRVQTPENAMLTITLGAICFRLGKYQEACRWVDALAFHAANNMTPRRQAKEDVVTYIEALSVSIAARTNHDWEGNHYIFRVMAMNLRAQVNSWLGEELLKNTDLPNYDIMCQQMFT